MTALTTLSNAKMWLATDGEPYPDTDDTLLMRLIDAVSGCVLSYLSRDLLSADRTWTGSGSGSARLMLPEYPVSAVSAVAVDGIAVPASPDSRTPGYQFDEWGLWRIGGIWPRGVRNVSVSYTAGLSSTPPEIEQAVIETVALRYRERDRVGYVSKSLAGETTAFTITDFPKDVLTLLRQYRKVVPI